MKAYVYFNKNEFSKADLLINKLQSAGYICHANTVSLNDDVTIKTSFTIRNIQKENFDIIFILLSPQFCQNELRFAKPFLNRVKYRKTLLKKSILLESIDCKENLPLFLNKLQILNVSTQQDFCTFVEDIPKWTSIIEQFKVRHIKYHLVLNISHLTNGLILEPNPVRIKIRPNRVLKNKRSIDTISFPNKLKVPSPKYNKILSDDALLSKIQELGKRDKFDKDVFMKDVFIREYFADAKEQLKENELVIEYDGRLCQGPGSSRRGVVIDKTKLLPYIFYKKKTTSKIELNIKIKSPGKCHLQFYIRESQDNTSNPTPIICLRSKIKHDLVLRIGEKSEHFADANNPFPIETLENKYQKETLPSGKLGWKLRVVFYETFSKNSPQSQELYLPETENSSVVMFTFITPPDRKEYRARIIILYKNRILQTAMFYAPIKTQDAIREGKPSLTIERMIERNLKNLDNKPAFDAALLFNQNEDGSPGIVGMADEAAARISLEGILPFVTNICNKISSFTAETRITSFMDQRIKKLLLFLAHQGNTIAEQVSALIPARIKNANRIHVLETHPGYFIPIEFFYNRESPNLDAELCSHAEVGLQAGVCNCGYTSNEELRKVICPFGFWGLTKVIERHNHEDLSGTITGDFEIEADDSKERKLIKPFSCALFAASSRVDSEKPDISKNLFSKIVQLTREAYRVHDWSKWEQMVKEHSPALLVLVVHNQQLEETGTPAIEIGDGKFLPSSSVEDRHIRLIGCETEPVVLLVGCSTAINKVLFQSFIPRLQLKGASVILATIASTLGQHAGPVTEEFLAELKAACNEGEKNFGDVLLRVRQKILAKGQPLALALTAFGDADYRITQ